MNQLIYVDKDGRITARELYDFLELDPKNYSRWARVNIEDNDFAVDGADYRVFVAQEENPQGGRPSTDYLLTIEFAKKLCMVSKSPKGEAARDYFLEVEKRYKQQAALPAMSQAEIVAAVAQIAADQERALRQLEATTAQQGQQIVAIKEAIITKDDDWRRGINDRLNAIAKARGGCYQDVRTESYDLLEARAACLLATRVKHMQARLTNTGGTKTQINAICKLSVIEADVRLKEIYNGIVREMAIKYIV